MNDGGVEMTNAVSRICLAPWMKNIGTFFDLIFVKHITVNKYQRKISNYVLKNRNESWLFWSFI